MEYVDTVEQHKVQHCTNDDDDNVKRASVWFEFFGSLF